MTLLIVEDDPEIRENLANLLGQEGFQVATAANGMAAWDWLHNASVLPDVILLDLRMPIMDGPQFRAEQLLDAELASIPVIILSGTGDVRKEATTLRAAGYLVKPFHLDALIGAVHRASAALQPHTP